MRMRLILAVVLSSGTLFSSGEVASVIAPAFASTDLDFFEKRVRPVLVQRCFECHSATAEKLKGGLLLDSREAILAGGDSGPAAVVDDVEKSLIIQAIRYDNENVQMPPAGKMPEAEIAVLTEWVRRGMPFPAASNVKAARRQIDIAEGKKHWAFQPLLQKSVAEVVRVRTDGDRVDDRNGILANSATNSRTRIDDFVFAAQREHKVSPSPEASRVTLIRRLKFDLLGLPPTQDEVDEFVADTSEDAYERLVERYLASPNYGERWGRYWLDLARYADVLEQWRTEPAKAWLYRDWVVKALNDDLPYDEFIRKQLAADLLEGFQPRDSAALGFLGLSPSYWKELKLDQNVIKQVVAEEWEERIEAVGATFLGLTLACARCHDHKFDPITQHDYYGLAGVLASIKLEDRPVIASDLAKAASEARAKIKELQEQIKKLEVDANKPEKTKPMGDASRVPDASPTRDASATIRQLRVQIEELRKTPQLETPAAFAVTEASLVVLPDGPNRTKLEYKPNEPQNVPMQIRGNAANPGSIVPRRFMSVLSPAEPTPFQKGSGRLELANAIVTDAAPLVARVIVNRIWAAHFGRGLVTTPSNFGTQGEKPSHPELLDDLAARFIQHDWSLKWLHRELVLSATYRQSSASKDEDGQAINPQASTRKPSFVTDPDNIWLARMTVRKLDVEAWRDAMLSATGELERTLGGDDRDLNDVSHRRRTVYGTIKRRELPDILRLHDFPDPVAHSGSRTPTTTPLQQLFVLNSSLMQSRAEALSRRIRSEGSSDLSEQVRLAYRLLFTREPTADETNLGIEFLKVSQGDGSSWEVAWRQYAQALLASNEFQFVD